MLERNFRSYVGLSRLGRTNNRYSIESCKGIAKPPAASMLNKLQEFFTNNFFGWFIHDWRVPKPFEYPPVEDSLYAMPDQEEITIAVAADWATDTVQSQYIGQEMGKKDADYTIHLGDTYFSGSPDELIANFGRGKSRKSGFFYGNWPRGRQGSFALCGNHEMFSSGYPYLAMITNPLRGFGSFDQNKKEYSGQESPNFCLYNDHWILLGLDTGYQSLNHGILQLNPTNGDLQLPKPVEQWICQTVKKLPGEKKRALIIFSHHQYITAFNEETEFHQPARQLKNLFPESNGVLWIWGHEHRFAMYAKNQIDPNHIAAFGRCIGHGGMPNEHSNSRHVIDKEAKRRKLVVFDKRTADHIPLSSHAHAKTQEVGFNGYAVITLKNDSATIDYYTAYKKDDARFGGRNQLSFSEYWHSVNGQLVFDTATDHTAGSAAPDRLSYSGHPVPSRVGN